MAPTRHAAPSSSDIRSPPSLSQPTAGSFDSIDPVLQTLDSVTRDTDGPDLSSEDPNRLADFAQHVLRDTPRNGELLFEEEGEDGLFAHQAPAQGFTELLDGHHEDERERERQREQERDLMNENGNGHGPGQGHGNAESGRGAEGHYEHQQQSQPQQQQQQSGMDVPPPPPPERGRRANNKRRRDDEVGTDGEGGQLPDAVRMKKDSHKEVERRRRENINEGINDLAKLIPDGTDKMGKGAFLRRAVEHVEFLTKQNKECADLLTGLGQDKAEMQRTIGRLTQQLEQEQERSIRYETSWREAEDRAAASQFELARVNAELDGLKRAAE